MQFRPMDVEEILGDSRDVADIIFGSEEGDEDDNEEFEFEEDD